MTQFFLPIGLDLCNYVICFVITYFEMWYTHIKLNWIELMRVRASLHTPSLFTQVNVVLSLSPESFCPLFICQLTLWVPVVCCGSLYTDSSSRAIPNNKWHECEHWQRKCLLPLPHPLSWFVMLLCESAVSDNPPLAGLQTLFSVSYGVNKLPVCDWATCVIPWINQHLYKTSWSTFLSASPSLQLILSLCMHGWVMAC